jgi:dephospho-CoA kinase
MAMKLIIGLAGTIGAGKDTAWDFLKEKYKFKEIIMGDLVREEAKEFGIEENRENLQSLAKEKTDKFGEDYWIHKAVKKLEKMDAERAIINGVRRPLDVLIPRQEFGDKFKAIFVDADVKIRFERLKARKRPGDPKNLDEFVTQEKNEWKQFDFEKTKSMSDYLINNDKGLKELHKQLTDLMKKLLK